MERDGQDVPDDLRKASGESCAARFDPLGIAPKNMYLMSVRGRSSGKLRSTPLTLVEGEERWLVAPYGEVNWVRNARAAGQVTLSRGRQLETVKIEEISPEESSRALKDYVNRVSIVRPYFDATPEWPVQEFAAEAPRHPVSRVVVGTS